MPAQWLHVYRMGSDEARRMGDDAESHAGIVEVPANVMEDIHLGLAREQVWSITKIYSVCFLQGLF